jgi:RNA polymerase sigma-70 factor, ECF subfamily
MEEDELAQSYRMHLVMLRRRAQRLLGTGAAAEDVVQQSFIQLIEYRRASGSDRNTGAFLYRTVTNLALNIIRDGRRRHELIGQHAADATPRAPGPDPARAVADRLALRRIFAEVSEEEAAVASYYYLDEMDQSEIAELLEVSRRTVLRRLASFQERARAFLGGGSIEAEGGDHVANINVQ